jgi:hypothetical protein
MNLLEVIATIRQGGGRFFVDAGDVLVEAEEGTVSAEARAILSANKATLLSLFATSTSATCSTSSSPEDSASCSPEPELSAENLPPAEAEALLVGAWREWWSMVLEDLASRQEPEPVRKTYPKVRATTTRATEWCEPGGGRTVIPAGAVGEVAVDLEGLVADLGRRQQIADTLARRNRAGDPALPILLNGEVRILPANIVRIG